MSQVTIHAAIAGHQGLQTVELILDGSTKLTGLRAACLRAVREQHPHLIGYPVVSMKYNATP